MVEDLHTTSGRAYVIEAGDDIVADLGSFEGRPPSARAGVPERAVPAQNGRETDRGDWLL